MHLDTHVFMHKHKSSGADGTETPVTYGILRAPKSDGKECIAVVVEYNTRPLGQEVDGHDQSTASPSDLSIATTLMRMLRHLKWVAKDIVLVAVQHSGDRALAREALAGWVDTYAAVGNQDDATFARAGTILSALVLEVPAGVHFKELSLHVGGHYGLLPNLDLPSTVLRAFGMNKLSLHICETHSQESWLATSPHSRSHGFVLNERQQALFRFMAEAAVGHPKSTGLHGHFLKHSIDAVTIRAVPSGASRPRGKSTKPGTA